MAYPKSEQDSLQAKEWTYCRPVSIMSPSLPYPVTSSAVSHDLVQSSPLLILSCCVAVILLLREGMATWPMPGSSIGPPNCNIGRIATPLPKRGITSSRVHAHTRIQSVSATCGCPGLSRAVTMRPGPVLRCVPDPAPCHSVSAWLKQVVMRRAMPQLSETEMGFDFHNPVASVCPGPLTHPCWQSKSECQGKQKNCFVPQC